MLMQHNSQTATRRISGNPYLACAQPYRKLIGETNDDAPPPAPCFLFPLPCSASVVLHPSAEREAEARSTLVRKSNIWQNQASFFLISLCPLLFKNSAEKEKTIFQNILAVISRKYKPNTSVEFLSFNGRT